MVQDRPPPQAANPRTAPTGLVRAQRADQPGRGQQAAPADQADRAVPGREPVAGQPPGRHGQRETGESGGRVPARGPQVVAQVDPAPVGHRTLGDQAAQGQQAEPQPQPTATPPGTVVHQAVPSHGARSQPGRPPGRRPGGTRPAAQPVRSAGQPASRDDRDRHAGHHDAAQDCGLRVPGRAASTPGQPARLRALRPAPPAEGRVERGHQRPPVRPLHLDPLRVQPHAQHAPRRRTPAPPCTAGQGARGPQEQRQDRHGGPAVPDQPGAAELVGRPAAASPAPGPAGPTSSDAPSSPSVRCSPAFTPGIRATQMPSVRPRRTK